MQITLSILCLGKIGKLAVTRNDDRMCFVNTTTIQWNYYVVLDLYCILLLTVFGSR